MKIKITNFEGPLDLLLQLIETEKLDITQITLAEIAGQFIAYLKQIEKNRPEILADFLLVAAKLLYLKSKALLPELANAADDQESAELAYQLKMYRRYYEASRLMEQKAVGGQKCFARQIHPEKIIFFHPPPSLNLNQLRFFMGKTLSMARGIHSLSRATLKKIISIREKIDGIMAKLARTETINLSFFFNHTDKQDIIVSFLSVLELAKQKKINIFQSSIFGEITLVRKNDSPAKS